ncbi:MAG TPA: single-stranded DNA-binding protein [Verrucomicrobiae bacterium]|nr:single-stranded DNA-binding protein [Verrucomicrobiae bacterium]
MNDINSITLLGRLVRDPQQHLAGTPNATTAFSVAANYRYQTRSGEWKDEQAFVRCAAFGRLAEAVTRYRKGSSVLVSGRLRTENWVKDDASHSGLVLVAATVHGVDRASHLPDASDKSPSAAPVGGLGKTVPF